jgi:hypothetical protein
MSEKTDKLTASVDVKTKLEVQIEAVQSKVKVTDIIEYLIANRHDLPSYQKFLDDSMEKYLSKHYLKKSSKK